MGFFRKTKKAAEGVDFSNLPRHIAIIMDGNGRWAKKRGLPRRAGHAAGAEMFRTIATYCKDIGIEYLTVYAFSTENWKRPQDEVSSIMSLLETYLEEAIADMEKNRVNMRFFGDVSVLSERLRGLIDKSQEISAQYEGCQVNFCINYGGRAEIVRAARLAAQGGEISDESMSANMWSAGVPDPELVIRPSGEYRLSNFLLWQLAYSELYFTDTLWPDFTPDEINRAIADFQKRNRRFGDVK